MTKSLHGKSFSRISKSALNGLVDSSGFVELSLLASHYDELIN